MSCLMSNFTDFPEFRLLDLLHELCVSCILIYSANTVGNCFQYILDACPIRANLWQIGSQCRSARTRVMWSRKRHPVMTRAINSLQFPNVCCGCPLLNWVTVVKSTSDYCTSETWRCLLRFIFRCVAVLSDGNGLPFIRLMKNSMSSIVTHRLFTLCEIWTVTAPMSTAVTGRSIVVVGQCRWWLLPFCRDLNDSNWDLTNSRVRLHGCSLSTPAESCCL